MTKDQLGDRICSILHICHCQRNCDRVFKPIKQLLEKYINLEDDTFIDTKYLTDEELLIIAMLDIRVKFVTHGVNIEYPIFFKKDSIELLNLINTYYSLEK